MQPPYGLQSSFEDVIVTPRLELGLGLQPVVAEVDLPNKTSVFYSHIRYSCSGAVISDLHLQRGEREDVGLYGRGRTVIRHCHESPYRDSPYKRELEKENASRPSSELASSQT
jgi:hypothetical protein